MLYGFEIPNEIELLTFSRILGLISKSLLQVCNTPIPLQSSALLIPCYLWCISFSQRFYEPSKSSKFFPLQGREGQFPKCNISLLVRFLLMWTWEVICLRMHVPFQPDGTATVYTFPSLQIKNILGWIGCRCNLALHHLCCDNSGPGGELSYGGHHVCLHHVLYYYICILY